MSDLALPHAAGRVVPRRRAAGATAEQLAAWVLAGPAIVLIWVMLLGPTVAVLVLSFTDWTFGMPEIGCRPHIRAISVSEMRMRTA